MAAATYRIGPSDFFTPGDLEADADTLDSQVEQLDAQIEGNEAAPESFVDQWVAFQGQWKTFYAQNFGGFLSSLFTSLNDANRDQLIAYENQLATFASSAASFGAVLISPVAPSTGSKDNLADQLKPLIPSLPSATSIVVVIVAVVVAYVIWKTA